MSFTNSKIKSKTEKPSTIKPIMSINRSKFELTPKYLIGS